MTRQECQRACRLAQAIEVDLEGAKERAKVLNFAGLPQLAEKSSNGQALMLAAPWWTCNWRRFGQEKEHAKAVRWALG